MKSPFNKWKIGNVSRIFFYISFKKLEKFKAKGLVIKAKGKFIEHQSKGLS